MQFRVPCNTLNIQSTSVWEERYQDTTILKIGCKADIFPICMIRLAQIVNTLIRWHFNVYKNIFIIIYVTYHVSVYWTISPWSDCTALHHYNTGQNESGGSSSLLFCQPDIWRYVEACFGGLEEKKVQISDNITTPSWCMHVAVCPCGIKTPHLKDWRGNLLQSTIKMMTRFENGLVMGYTDCKYFAGLVETSKLVSNQWYANPNPDSDSNPDSRLLLGGFGFGFGFRPQKVESGFKKNRVDSDSDSHYTIELHWISRIQIRIRIQSSWIRIRIQEKWDGFEFGLIRIWARWIRIRIRIRMPGFAHHCSIHQESHGTDHAPLIQKGAYIKKGTKTVPPHSEKRAPKPHP